MYTYCVAVFSSRRIQRRLVEDVAFRVLAANNQPDFRTIADFREPHLATLQGFFEQVLRWARELGAPRVRREAVARDPRVLDRGDSLGDGVRRPGLMP